MTEAQSLTRAIHEDVVLCPYNPEWPTRFLAERERLLSMFPTQLLDVQHFGSTAIPGMPAKPIIDILAGVASMAMADALMEPLLQSGYTTSTEFNATLLDRRWLMRWADGRRTHHLHLVVLDGTQWRRRLHFRDALQASRELATGYAELKRQLAALHMADREAYTLAKTEFILSVACDVHYAAWPTSSGCRCAA